MTELKCPKCGGRLVYWGATGALLKCEQCKFGWGNEELWQELMRTCKALEIAVDRLKEMTWGCDSSDAEHLLKEIKQITAEQKDQENAKQRTQIVR